MKAKYVLLPLLIIALVQPCMSQKPSKWRIGISANYGRDFYKRKIHSPEKIPGLVENFHSDYSWGAGLIAERKISTDFSLTSRLGYSTQDLANNTLCFDCGSTSQWYQYERHHWIAGGIGIRGYLPSKSNFKLFAETGLQADWFLGYTEALNHNKEMHWNADGYKRLTPSANFGLGFQVKRWALLAEYQSNVARTFSRPASSISGVSQTPKTSLLRSGFSLKTTFYFNRNL